MFLLLLIPVLFMIDFTIKNTIEKQEDSFFPSSLELGGITIHRSHNTGMLMGLFNKFPMASKLIPTLITTLATIFYLPFYFKKGDFIMKLSGVLVLSGALNNLYDRFTRSYVVDYFSLPFKKIKHVIFNLSDMFIFIGSLLLLISELRKRK